MNTVAAKKIEMMRASIRCLAFGLLGFLPGIGLPFVVASLVTSGRVRAMEKELWNPAKNYRVIGIVCAMVATATWILVAGISALITIKNNCGGC